MINFIKQFTPENSFMLVARELDQDKLKQGIKEGYVEVVESTVRSTHLPCVKLTTLGRLKRIHD